ncbi:MAG: hypothetical protein ACI8R9_000607 [Paraglaciecola sp.]
MDNIFAEGLWRIVKYEDMYLKKYVGLPYLSVEITESTLNQGDICLYPEGHFNQLGGAQVNFGLPVFNTSN